MVGQAKARRRAHGKLLASHPGFIYCAGASPAATVDQMPPIMMFDQWQRPKGLEFPACKECNNGTSLTDSVASLLGRVYPDCHRSPSRVDLHLLGRDCLDGTAYLGIDTAQRRRGWCMDSYPFSNRLLLSLPPRNLNQLAPKLECIRCERDQILLDVDASIDHVFFPNSGVISIVAVYADG